VSALILTYHAVEAGSSPLHVTPELLEEHLDCIVAAGARVLTVSALGEAIRRGELDGPTVALTFDDGLASVTEQAAPVLAQRGLVATMFCVAARLGGTSAWPSRNPGTPVLPLASAEDVAALAAAGWEIGAHGLHHDPLDRLPLARLTVELAESRCLLEDAADAPVRSFAFPYGAVSPDARRALVAAGYDAACGAQLALVPQDCDPLALPRVDAHYLRRPALLRAALDGRLGTYLAARRFAARTRRAVREDYRRENARSA
jgi:peptidoglycan/xylan/chitin deacetylase (PgdA/CDA1 family)